MSNTTSMNLGDHFTGMLADLIAGGRYKNASEAVREGLRLLEERKAGYITKLEALRQMIDEGDASGESDCTHEEIIAETRAELKAELNAE